MNKGKAKEYLLFLALFLAYGLHIYQSLQRALVSKEKEKRASLTYEERKRYFDERIVKKGGLRLHRAQYYKQEEGKE